MALVQCPECNNSVSTTASSCPHCGYKAPPAPSLANPQPGVPKKTPNEISKGPRITAFIALVIVLVWTVWMVNSYGNKGNAPEVVATESDHVTPTAPEQSSYKLPPDNTQSIISDISATRTSNGAIVISGQTLLPPGTTIGIARESSSGALMGQSKTQVDAGGKFSSEPFSDKGKPPKEGMQKIRIDSWFNGAWQQESVLSIIGKGGANLPSSALKAHDPEFPDAGRYLNESHTIRFPAIPGDVIAIQWVKNAKLNVQGRGQAVDTVEEVVALFAQTPGLRPLGWSAEKSDSKWIVTLDWQDGSSRKKAQWEFDPANEKVRYLDPLSKTLSWAPAD